MQGKFFLKSTQENTPKTFIAVAHIMGKKISTPFHAVFDRAKILEEKVINALAALNGNTLSPPIIWGISDLAGETAAEKTAPTTIRNLN